MKDFVDKSTENADKNLRMSKRKRTVSTEDSGRREKIRPTRELHNSILFCEEGAQAKEETTAKAETKSEAQWETEATAKAEVIRETKGRAEAKGKPEQRK